MRRLPRPVRLAGSVGITLLAASVVSFLLVALLPGDIALIILADSATPERVEALRADLGLDQPLPLRYVHWLGDVLSGDFGRGVHSGVPTLDLILQRLPVTLELIVLTQIVALGIAIPLGIWSAYRRGRAVDHVTLSGCLAFLSTPPFVLGLLVIYVFALNLRWLPATGFVPLDEGLGANLRSMILPVVSLAMIEVPIYLRLLRSEMIGTLQQNFISLARGMGLPTWRILFENALRPSSLTLITVAGINMGRRMGGAIVIEQMLALPGLGQLLVQSPAGLHRPAGHRVVRRGHVRDHQPADGPCLFPGRSADRHRREEVRCAPDSSLPSRGWRWWRWRRSGPSGCPWRTPTSRAC